MADFSLTMTLQFPLTAKNQEQAEERAERVADSIKWLAARWLGDITMDTEVAEERCQE